MLNCLVVTAILTTFVLPSISSSSSDDSFQEMQFLLLPRDSPTEPLFYSFTTGMRRVTSNDCTQYFKLYVCGSMTASSSYMAIQVVLPEDPFGRGTQQVLFEASTSDSFLLEKRLVANFYFPDSLENNQTNASLLYLGDVAAYPANTMVVNLKKNRLPNDYIYFRLKYLGAGLGSVVYTINVQFPKVKPSQRNIFNQRTSPWRWPDPLWCKRVNQTLYQFLHSAYDIVVPYNHSKKFLVGFCPYGYDWYNIRSDWGVNFVVYTNYTENEFSGFGLQVCAKDNPPVDGCSATERRSTLEFKNISQPAFSFKVYGTDHTQAGDKPDLRGLHVTLYGIGAADVNRGRLSAYLIPPNTKFSSNTDPTDLEVVNSV